MCLFELDLLCSKLIFEYCVIPHISFPNYKFSSIEAAGDLVSKEIDRKYCIDYILLNNKKPPIGISSRIHYVDKYVTSYFTIRTWKDSCGRNTEYNKILKNILNDDWFPKIIIQSITTKNIKKRLKELIKVNTDMNDIIEYLKTIDMESIYYCDTINLFTTILSNNYVETPTIFKGKVIANFYKIPISDIESTVIVK